LFAEFVGGDTVEQTVAFDRDRSGVVGVDGVLAALAKKIEPVGEKVVHEVSALD